MMSQPLTNTVDTSPGEHLPARPAVDERHDGSAHALLARARADRLLSAAAAASVAVMVGGLGPQAGATTNLSVASINVGAVTTYSIVPGWVYLLTGLVAAAGLFQYLRSGSRNRLWMTRIAAGVSVAGAIVTWLQTAADSEIGVGATGWGFYVVLISSVALAVMTRVLFRRTWPAGS
jgi:hypothetical protein